MYKRFCQFAERILRIPPPPEHPPGDEHTTQIFHAAPNFYKYLMAIWALKTAVFLLPATVLAILPAAGAIALIKQGNNWGVFLPAISFLVLAVFILGRLFALAVVRMDFEKRWYIVTDRSLRIREGIIHLREMTVNFANIQNISISQGPIQRVLEIADLRVDTAGGGGGGGQDHSHYRHESENLHTAFFRGVNNAHEVRALIQERIRHLKDSGLGDHEEITHPVAAPSLILSVLREIQAEAAAFNEVLRHSVGS